MTLPRASLATTIAFLWLFALGASRVHARGDLIAEEDACVLKVGPDIMYFAGYQAAASNRKFCEEAPALGETIFVFDYAEPELREMNADFRILRQSSGDEPASDLQAATVAYLPPAAYPLGTFSFRHEFAAAGDYVGVVTVDGANGQHWVARFPFSVGKGGADRTPYYLIAGAAAIALLLAVFGRNRRPRGRGDRLTRPA